MSATIPVVPISEANLRIARLCRQPVPALTVPENLDLPLDADIKVSGESPGVSKISLLLDGVEVSWCRVVEFQQQIGTQLLRMGGIADVGTHNDHRFQGYSRRVLENALRWMCGDGFGVSMLYGISGYYPKYGYAEALPTVVHTMMVRDAEHCAASSFGIVDYSPAYLDSVLAMYHAQNAGRTGVTRRDPLTWQPFRKGLNWGSMAIAKVLLNQRGQAVGYFVYDAAQETTIIEVGATSPEIYGPIIRAVADLAWNTRSESFRFHLAEDDDIIRYCRPMGIRSEITYRRDGGAMVRIINLRSTMEKLLPLLATRVSGRVNMTIQTNLDTVTLSRSGQQFHLVGDTAKQKVFLPQWALAQLIYGYHDVATLSQNGVISGSPQSLQTLSRLFPVQVAFQYAVDNF